MISRGKQEVIQARSTINTQPSCRYVTWAKQRGTSSVRARLASAAGAVQGADRAVQLGAPVPEHAPAGRAHMGVGGRESRVGMSCRMPSHLQLHRNFPARTDRAQWPRMCCWGPPPPQPHRPQPPPSNTPGPSSLDVVQVKRGQRKALLLGRVGVGAAVLLRGLASHLACSCPRFAQDGGGGRGRKGVLARQRCMHASGGAPPRRPAWPQHRGAWHGRPACQRRGPPRPGRGTAPHRPARQRRPSHW